MSERLTEETIRRASDAICAQGYDYNTVVCIATQDGDYGSGDYNAWLSYLAAHGRVVDPASPLRWLRSTCPDFVNAQTGYDREDGG